MEKYLSTILSKRGKIGAFLELSRPWNGIVMFMMTLIGIFFITTTFPLILSFLAAISFLIIYMAGTTLNDISDFEIDKINMPYRPLQSGRINKKESWIFSGILYSISLFTAFLLSFSFLLIVVLFAIISFLYSMPPILLSRKSFIGNLTLAIVSILVPVYGGSVLASDSFTMPQTFWYNFLSLTLLFAFVVIVKDFKDIFGDKKEGKKTFAVHVGKKRALSISIVGAMIFFILSVFLFGLIYQNIIFYIISVVILSFLIMVYNKFRKSKNISEDEKGFGLIRIVMISFIILILFFQL